MTSWKTQVMPPSPVLRFWQLTNSIQSEGPNELCDGAWTAEQASSPTQPLSCEIQPFTCVLNRFLDKHLQASSCKYIRISIIFFHVGSHIEFSPLRKVKHKPKNLQKKRYKTNQRAANILCLQHDKHTSYWEEHSILTKSSGSHRTGGCKLYPEHYFHQYFTNTNVSRVNASNFSSPANLVYHSVIFKTE